MQFGPDALQELIAPAGVPFTEGFDVIGFGTALPPELASYYPFGVGGNPIRAAIIFYNSAWDPTSTTPLIKFHFIAPSSDPALKVAALILGMGICNNPSVSTVATCVSGVLVGAQNSFAGHMSTVVGFGNHLDVDVTEIGEYNAAGNGGVVTFNSTGGTQTNGVTPTSSSIASVPPNI